MFAQKLEDAVSNISGGHSAVIMGFDGIPLDQYAKSDEPDIETVGMEYSVLLKEVRKASEMLDAGTTDELLIRSEKMATVLRVVNDQYFVALVLVPSGNIGKARYLLRMLVPVLQAELI